MQEVVVRPIECPHCGELNVNYINGAICDFCGGDLFDEEESSSEYGI